MGGTESKPAGQGDPLEEWRLLCAAMTAHEERAARTASPDGCCILSGYCCLQCMGLVLEVPCRGCYHACCLAASTGCVWLTCGAELPASIGGHHALTLQEYYYLAHLIVSNLGQPFDPVYIYKPDVRLKRPPPPGRTADAAARRAPPAKKDCCTCSCTPTCDNCTPGCTPELECCTCMSWFEPLLHREIRSLLCVFSCLSACHCGRCCGPLPCVEDTETRHARWLLETDADMERRTQVFMRTYDPQALTFKKTRSGRRIVIVTGEPIKNAELEPKPKGDTGETMAPTPQAMLRDSAPPQASSKGGWF